MFFYNLNILGVWCGLQIIYLKLKASIWGLLVAVFQQLNQCISCRLPLMNVNYFKNTLIKTTCSAAVLITIFTAISSVEESSPPFKNIFFAYNIHFNVNYGKYSLFSISTISELGDCFLGK